MQLVPVLEIRHGKCVYTQVKNAFASQVVSSDPMITVERWYQHEIERIHFVDVDAIESGEPENVNLLRRLKESFEDLQIQVIGGVKNLDAGYIWVDAGADYIVVNGKALRQKNLLIDLCLEFPGKILVEIDSRNGAVGMGAGEPTFELNRIAEQLADDGVVGLVVTEIPEQGHVNTLNLLNVNNLSRQTELPVYANGGIEKIADLKTLLDAKADALSGIIIGKSVHSHEFELAKAQQLIQQHQLAG